MADVITTYMKLGAKPVSTLTVAAGARAADAGDAVRAVVSAQRGQPFVGRRLHAGARPDEVDGAAGPLQARLYDATPGHPGEPIILYFHGGGWVTGDLNTYDASDRALATQAHAMVLSVAYRLAPENRFPAAHDDAFASYRWLLANAASLGADPRRIAVAGESAGGNLAINVSIAARDAHMTMPVHQLLIYPVAGTDTGTPSYIADQYARPAGARRRALVREQHHPDQGGPAGPAARPDRPRRPAQPAAHHHHLGRDRPARVRWHVPDLQAAGVRV